MDTSFFIPLWELLRALMYTLYTLHLDTKIKWLRENTVNDIGNKKWFLCFLSLWHTHMHTHTHTHTVSSCKQTCSLQVIPYLDCLPLFIEEDSLRWRCDNKQQSKRVYRNCYCMHSLYVRICCISVCSLLFFRHRCRENQSQLSVFNQALDTDSLPWEQQPRTWYESGFLIFFTLCPLNVIRPYSSR